MTVESAGVVYDSATQTGEAETAETDEAETAETGETGEVR